MFRVRLKKKDNLLLKERIDQKKATKECQEQYVGHVIVVHIQIGLSSKFVTFVN